jgi:hypothetical protein
VVTSYVTTGPACFLSPFSPLFNGMKIEFFGDVLYNESYVKRLF